MPQTHDTSFAPPTIGGSTYSLRIGTQSDGKLLVRLESGSIGTATDNGLYRLNVDGSLDETWVGQYHWRRDGQPYPPDGFLVLPDDRVLVWSKEEDVPRPDAAPRSSVRLVRLLPDGELDTTFPAVDMFRPLLDSAGYTRIALDADGNYLVARNLAQIAHDEGPDLYPERDNDFGQLVRMYPDGTLDLTTHIVTMVSGIYFGLPLADGRILVVGSGFTPGLYVDGVDVAPFLRGRAILNHDFSYDNTFNGNSTFDGYARAATDALQLSNGQLAIFGPFQLYEWGGGSYLRSLARVNLSGTRIQWPNTSPSGYWNVVSFRWDGVYTTGMPYGHMVQDYKGRVYVTGRGTPVRLKLDGTQDTDWDHTMHLGSSNPPVDTPWQARMALDPTHTKLYIAGGSDLTQVAGVPTERIVRFDVDTFDGLGAGSIMLTATEGEDPDDPDDPDEPEVEPVTESLALSADDDSLPIHLLRSKVALDETGVGKIEAANLILESLAFDARLQAMLMDLVTESVAFDVTAGDDYLAMARLIERALLSGEVATVQEATAAVLEALVICKMADILAYEGVTDSAALSAAVSDSYTAMAQAINTLLLSPLAAGVNHATALVRESVVLSVESAASADFAAVAREAISMAMHISLDSGDYVAWVLNTESRGVSTYSQYPFNSFAKLGGQYYGATSDGVYLLEGDDDAGEPIAARIRLGMHDMNTRKLKRIPEAYIGYKSDGNLILRVILTDDRTGEKVAAQYLMRPRPAAALRESRFELGRGLKAVDWDFEFENADGADFELAEVEFHPLIMDRRTRG